MCAGRYTSFGYSALAVAGSGATRTVSFTLANTGQRAGAEVAQLYLSFPPAAGEPPRVLRGFSKVQLDAGATREVSLSLAPRDFSVWDATAHAWAVQRGTFGVSVGASSRDIRLVANVSV